MCVYMYIQALLGIRECIHVYVCIQALLGMRECIHVYVCIQALLGMAPVPRGGGLAPWGHWPCLSK